MFITRNRCRWNKYFSVRTRRCFWCLVLLFLAANAIWYSQSYVYKTSRDLSDDIYSTINKATANNERENVAITLSYYQVRHTQDKLPLLDDHRALDEAKNTTRLQRLQQPFVKLNCNRTDLKGSPEQVEVSKDCQLRLEPNPSNSDIVKYFTLHTNDTKDNFVNLHRYGYLIDSPTCKESPPDVVILVHSKYDHFNAREQLRATWASNRTVNGIKFKTVFFVGQPNLQDAAFTEAKPKVADKQEKQLMAEQATKLAEVMEKIRLESEKFGDIVMGNFTDSYRNLTYKHIMVFDWVVTHCPQVWYIAKVDDDVIVNIYKVSTYVGHFSKKAGEKTVPEVGSVSNNRRGLIACKKAGILEVKRKNDVKWSSSINEYPFPAYPQWCLGFGLLMTQDVVQQLLQASQDMRSFWIDDVFVTGLLRVKVGLSLTPLYGTDDTNTMFVLHKFIKNQSFMGFWKMLVAAHVGPV